MHEKVFSVLQKIALPYVVHRHKDFNTVIASPKDFAAALGYNIERITKTLFLSCQEQKNYVVVVCSVTKKLNFGLIAQHINCKRVQMANPLQLQTLVGYPPTGVSPVGIDGVPVIIDKQLLEFPTILIGAGEVGVEIEIEPSHLKEIINAVIISI